MSTQLKAVIVMEAAPLAKTQTSTCASQMRSKKIMSAPSPGNTAPKILPSTPLFQLVARQKRGVSQGALFP
jgi:hypothetical protein